MGLFYSMFSSLYPASSPPIKFCEIKITLSAMRLIKYLKLRQERLQLQTRKIESNLLNLMNSPKQTRSVQGQLELINTILTNTQLFTAYEDIIACANSIKSEAKTLQTQFSQISKRCMQSLCTIAYCYEPLQLSEAIKLQQFLPQSYPKIQESQLTQALQLYLQHKKTNKGIPLYEMNMYMLEMCGRNGISLEKVNEAGHQFSYNPQSLIKRKDNQGFDEKGTKSSQFFALEFQQNQIREWQKEFAQPKLQHDANNKIDKGQDGDFAI